MTHSVNNTSVGNGKLSKIASNIQSDHLSNTTQNLLIGWAVPSHCSSSWRAWAEGDGHRWHSFPDETVELSADLVDALETSLW